MSAFSAFRSAAYIATIASVVGVLNTPVLANDANTASVVREIGNASRGAEAFSINAQSAQTARAQVRGGSQRPTQQVPQGVVNSSRSFDFGRFGHN
jgi:hypothetical protein